MFRTADRRGGIPRKDLGADEIIEEHPNRGEVLFYSGNGTGVCFDIRGDGNRLDLSKTEQLFLCAP